ncbi:replication factor A protein 2 [Arachnomyces sp. PD_36]|nr:replication factor A protein 2 [Arachnomyces sp. PD_36]
MDYGYGDQYNSMNQATSGGGGFMEGQNSASPSGKSYAKDTLRPVTVKQILDATQAHPDADFKIDGADISQLTFVGQVRNISTQTTNITYKIDDGTGEVEVKQWLDEDTAQAIGDDMMDIGNNDPKSSKPQQVVLNGYARVFGKMKSFNNKRHVGAHVIRPLMDLNEVHCHLLEATAIHLYFTRGPPPTAGGDANAQGGAAAAGGAAAGAGAGAAAGATAMGGNVLQGVSPTARKLYQTLANTTQSQDGLHVQHLAADMGLPVADVYKASEELLTNGLIFTTIDENTWAILELC